MASAEDRPLDPSHGQGTPTRRFRAQSQREFELDLFGRILERDPLYVAVLRVHGNNLSATGQYSRALIVDRRMVRLQPERPVPWYNLACSYSRMGMIDPAFAALHRALELGYRLFEHMARDPDLKALRSDPRFSRLVTRRLLRND